LIFRIIDHEVKSQHSKYVMVECSDLVITKMDSSSSGGSESETNSSDDDSDSETGEIVRDSHCVSATVQSKGNSAGSESDFEIEDHDVLGGGDDHFNDFQVRDGSKPQKSAVPCKGGGTKQLDRDPMPGDFKLQHADKIVRLIRQAEASSKSCYLGPAVGWEKDQLEIFFKSIDAEINDDQECFGELSNLRSNNYRIVVYII
jgi:hypothetical protein